MLTVYESGKMSFPKPNEIPVLRASLYADMYSLVNANISSCLSTATSGQAMLSDANIEALRALSYDSESAALVDWLEESNDTLKDLVFSLPLVYSVPPPNSQILRITSNGQVKLLTTSAVGVGPVGFGLGRFVSRKTLDTSYIVKRMLETRNDCGNLTVSDVEIAAHYAALVTSVRRNDWRNTYPIIKDLQCLMLGGMAKIQKM
jgi:hypothetical protein